MGHPRGRVWDGSAVTLNAHVNPLNRYFVTNLATTFQYAVSVTFCGARGAAWRRDGSCFTGKALRDIYAAWARVNGVRSEE